MTIAAARLATSRTAEASEIQPREWKAFERATEWLNSPRLTAADLAIWRAFDNHYWPALYFLDQRRRVRDHH